MLVVSVNEVVAFLGYARIGDGDVDVSDFLESLAQTRPIGDIAMSVVDLISELRFFVGRSLIFLNRIEIQCMHSRPLAGEYLCGSQTDPGAAAFAKSLRIRFFWLSKLFRQCYRGDYQ